MPKLRLPAYQWETEWLRSAQCCSYAALLISIGGYGVMTKPQHLMVTGASGQGRNSRRKKRGVLQEIHPGCNVVACAKADGTQPKGDREFTVDAEDSTDELEPNRY